MATIQIHLDGDTKTAADLLFNRLGLDTESALKVYLSTIIKSRWSSFSFWKLFHNR